jgi:hypothetical protein
VTFGKRLLAIALVSVWIGPGASPAGADAPDPRLKAGPCRCAEGKACRHYLRSPMRPPEDPCRCGACVGGGNCSMHARPKGWSAECMESDTVECFWKRHASSWGIQCHRCAIDTECTACDGLPGAPTAAVKAQLKKQRGLEFPVYPGKDGIAQEKTLAVAWSRHFYVATDIQQLRLHTQPAGQRFADAHEIAHLFLERAEKAFDDFVSVWGNEIRLDKPMAIYLATHKEKKEGWRAAYFGGAGHDMIYAGAEGKIAGGFCWNGFAASLDEYSKDRDLHAYVRHMIGHILFSCWHGVGGFLKECPRWAFVGAADWLCKYDPLFADWTVFCQDEGGAPVGDGRDWDTKAKLIAGGNRLPIEKLFVVPSMSHLTYDDHVRSWSYMDVMLREDRVRWLNVMRKLREGKDAAVAFQAGMGLTPDEFDRRWAARLGGRIKTMAETPAEAAAPDAVGPDKSERRRLLSEQDPVTLGSLLRAITVVEDVRTAEMVLSRAAVDSDLVRETVVMLLAKTKAPEVLEWLRTTGLAAASPHQRAVVARVLGMVKDPKARAVLEGMLSDVHWLVRANCATALSQIADPASAPVLAASMDDRTGKAFIAKADALITFGRAGSKATPEVVRRLDASDWQVRVTACKALAAMGTADAVEPLIDRLDEEGGRILKEVWKALRALTGETFGPRSEEWRRWWKKQKPDGLPPPPPPVKNPEDDKYAPPKRPGSGGTVEDPTYYGKRVFSQSLTFVLDISGSMATTIEIPEDSQKKLGIPPAGTRIAVAKAAARTAVSRLDPRGKFNVVFFSTDVNPWKDTLVSVSGYREQAMDAIDNVQIGGETNIHGALRAAMGLHWRSTAGSELDANSDTIYFLTDGAPTRGEITDVETLLSWARDANRFAKVELHVIAMGTLGIDIPFLRRLAAENGGSFTHVPDHK